MKTLRVAVILAALPLEAAAQDAPKVDPAHYIKHESKNTSGRPIDFVIVAIR